MQISEFSHISRFINNIVANGYDDGTLTTLLQQYLDIHDQKISDDVAKLLLIKHGDNKYAHATELPTFAHLNIADATIICDELCAPTIVRHIILNNIMLDKVCDHSIINCGRIDNIHEAYEHGYKIIPKTDFMHNTRDDDYIYTDNLQQVHNASCNGLYDTQLRIWCKNIGKVSKEFNAMLGDLRDICLIEPNISTRSLLSRCTNLEKLNVKSCRQSFKDVSNDKYNVICDNIKKFATFFECNTMVANGLKKICIPSMDDKCLQYCTSLTELNASHSDGITTCNPFAKTLRKLDARSSKMNNIGLRWCKNIKELDASCNPNITTCKPFAKTLKILNATCLYCINNSPRASRSSYLSESEINKEISILSGINNKGLSLCTRIKELNASNNVKITTCAPFAKALRKLNAGGRSGISDDGLSLCKNIKKLIANNNPRITTCMPFAKTLKILEAASSYNVYYADSASGINDIGLLLCENIENLNANDNPKITTCAPFAKTLKILSANKFSGIDDSGLLLCENIGRLYANDNSRITTCAPFAKTIKSLSVCGSSGIGDDEILLCANLRYGYVNSFCNPKITIVLGADGKFTKSELNEEISDYY